MSQKAGSLSADFKCSESNPYKPSKTAPPLMSTGKCTKYKPAAMALQAPVKSLLEVIRRRKDGSITVQICFTTRFVCGLFFLPTTFVTDNMKRSPWTPFIYFSLVAFGLLLGIWLKPASGLIGAHGSIIDEAISLAKAAYVDTINEDQLKQQAMEGMLKNLDPHSVYIPASDLQAVNEPLEGEFDGIGVEFSIFRDTILVVSAINGGPSQQAGIMSGDKIVKVNDKVVAGTKITNEQVMKLLKGKKGTHVKVGIMRRSKAGLISFDLVRDKIPIYSVDAGYMLDSRTGYIKVSRFAEKTYEEFLSKLQLLKDKGMKQLVVDLRGNPGGYLSAAVKMADELLSGSKMVVYTEGKHQKRSSYTCEHEGLFESGKLIILVDEGAASASEILSGCIQDWDRGLIIGRRSFGKGLVQEQMGLSDGSALRLTVARYYTPTGRCIQKSYDHDLEGYESEVYNRFKNGELSKPDSQQLLHHKAFKTPAGRTVYDGGGISPDIFVPADTGGKFILVNSLLQENALREIALNIYESGKTFISKSGSPEQLNQLLQSASNDGLRQIRQAAAQYHLEKKLNAVSEAEAFRYVKALVSRMKFGEEGFYYIFNQDDKTLMQALDVFNQSAPWKDIH